LLEGLEDHHAERDEGDRDHGEDPAGLLPETLAG
jgi:hypothetical protein